MNDQEFDKSIEEIVCSVNAPESLKDRLLAIPETEGASSGSAEMGQAANESRFLLKRILPVAACLLVAIAILLTLPPSANSQLEQEVFAHIYFEEFLLEEEGAVSMVEVNNQMAKTLGAEFMPNTEVESLKIRTCMECWIAHKSSVHMIVEGHEGAVSVLMMPNDPVAREFTINDQRFDGLVTPTAQGNLVVVGEKGEEIPRYSTLLASNISWN